MSVHKRGQRWHVRLQIGGVKISRSVGSAGTKQDAVALEAKIRAEALAGRMGAQPDRSVDDAINRWMQGEAKNLRSYDALLSQVRAILPHTKDVNLQRIGDVAESVRIEGTARGLSAATINRRLALLRHVAKLAFSNWGWLTEDVGRRIRMLPGEVQRSTYLTPAQVELLADCCEHEKVRLAIRLAARTGLREAELLTVDTIYDGCIVVPSEIAKSARPRLVPVPVDMPGLQLPVGITYATLRTYFERARFKAGMPKVRFHDLRHSAASWFIQSGANLAVVRDLLGHANLAVTSRYAHLLTEDLRAASRKVAEMISAVNCAKTAQDPISD